MAVDLKIPPENSYRPGVDRGLLIGTIQYLEGQLSAEQAELVLVGDGLRVPLGPHWQSKLFRSVEGFEEFLQKPAAVGSQDLGWTKAKLHGKRVLVVVGNVRLGHHLSLIHI